MTKVWPALWPPWKRTTMSACSDNQSTILPFPSSPHWAPTTTTLAISRVFPLQLSQYKHDLVGKPMPTPPSSPWACFCGSCTQPKSRPGPLACEASNRIPAAGYRRSPLRGWLGSDKSRRVRECHECTRQGPDRGEQCWAGDQRGRWRSPEVLQMARGRRSDGHQDIEAGVEPTESDGTLARRKNLRRQRQDRSRHRADRDPEHQAGNCRMQTGNPHRQRRGRYQRADDDRRDRLAQTMNQISAGWNGEDREPNREAG